jgi:hypothetical protein
LQLLPGDTLYLMREGSELKAGFRLTAAAGSSSSTGKASGRKARPRKGNVADAVETGNPSKRNKIQTAAGEVGLEQQQPQADTDNGAAGAAAAAAAGAAAAAAAAAAATGVDGVPAAVAGNEQQQQQVFAGVRLCVWDHNHTQQAVKLAVRAGATLQAQLDADTTHVIAA